MERPGRASDRPRALGFGPQPESLPRRLAARATEALVTLLGVAVLVGIGVWLLGVYTAVYLVVYAAGKVLRRVR